MSAHFQDSTFCIELCRPVVLLEKTSVSETTDVSTSLKPEFVVVVDKIYREMCNLQAGTKVLIIADSRTVFIYLFEQ